VKGAVPPVTCIVAVPDDWQRLSVVTTGLMDKGTGAGHWADVVYVYNNNRQEQRVGTKQRIFE
jgi:hypothetical protein